MAKAIPVDRMASASRRCVELLQRISSSYSIVSSALELRRVSPVLEEETRRRHVSGESGFLDFLTENDLIVQTDPTTPHDPQKARSLIADMLAKQTAINAATVISAAIVILSHSTADDIFTDVCNLAIDLDGDNWISQLNLDSKVSLRSLQEKGAAGVFTEELERFKIRLAGKSLPNRARILFDRVPIKLHADMRPDDPSYFKMSRLLEVDELRKEIVHKNGLPRTDPLSGEKYAGFLHEAAGTALRSVVSAFRIPWDLEYWQSLFTQPNS